MANRLNLPAELLELIEKREQVDRRAGEQVPTEPPDHGNRPDKSTTNRRQNEGRRQEDRE